MSSRRNFLRGVGFSAAGLAVTGLDGAPAVATSFHGAHQAGIVTPQQAQATHVAFDLSDNATPQRGPIPRFY